MVDCTNKNWSIYRSQPKQMLTMSLDEIMQENRRLFHVAMSRAKQELIIAYYNDDPCLYVKDIQPYVSFEKINVLEQDALRGCCYDDEDIDLLTVHKKPSPLLQQHL
jgi:superfamily I DNA/RNA helicase